MPQPEDEPAASRSGWMPSGSEWDWMHEEYPIAFTLMFVHGVRPERVIVALGADPAHALMLSADETLETLSGHWARVGRSGDWAFVFDDSDLGISDLEQIANELSAGTEALLLESNPNIAYFWYYADGVEATAFEPMLSAWRGGSDPDRFVPQMRQVGLDVDPPADDDDSELEGDPMIALLDMVTLALGIRLSREVALGPLLTVEPSRA
jgi:hypothetical protein